MLATLDCSHFSFSKLTQRDGQNDRSASRVFAWNGAKLGFQLCFKLMVTNDCNAQFILGKDLTLTSPRSSSLYIQKNDSRLTCSNCLKLNRVGVIFVLKKRGFNNILSWVKLDLLTFPSRMHLMTFLHNLCGILGELGWDSNGGVFAKLQGLIQLALTTWHGNHLCESLDSNLFHEMIN